MLEELATLSTSIDASRAGVADALHTAVGEATDKRIRNAILEMRRSLFNERIPSDALLARALEGMSADSRAVAEPFVHLLKERVRVRTDIASEHGVALAVARRTFRRRLTDERFLKGLLLSSPTLYQNVGRYRAHENDHLDSRLEQIERGLLRYFTRAATKGTPFATFCTVVAGRVQPPGDGTPELVQVKGNVTEQRGVVRLNRRLLSILWSHLKTRPAVRRALAVNLNTTLQRDGGRWVFLARVDGREVFQRLGQSEALEQVLDVVRRNPEATLGDLIDALAQAPELDTTSDEATAYLDALIERGLLTFRPPVGEQEPDWPEPLRQLLEPIPDEHAALIAGMLSRLRDLAAQLESTRAEERIPLAGEMRRILDHTREAIGISLESLNGLLYYEDATADALIALNEGPESTEALAAMIRLIEVTRSLAYPRALQATMRHFFDARFDDRPSVTLLEFYERFYREHFKQHQEKEARVQRGDKDDTLRDFDSQNPFRLAHVDKMRSAVARITALIRAAWLQDPEALAVDVSAVQLTEAVADLPVPVSAFSSSFFCHGFVRNHRTGMVQLLMPAAHYSAGFGKYYSRFLHLLPVGLADSIRCANQSLTEDILAELCTDSDFNADLHPPLLADAIAYPTAETHAHATLTALELDVIAAPAEPHRLQLVHRPTGRTVLPIDLGFRNPKMRPPLFQLLSFFAPCGSFAAFLPDALSDPIGDSTTVGDDSASSSSQVVYRPRIVYDGRVIVARRRWTVSRAGFPLRALGETAPDYFLRVNEWRHQWDIPHEVFVRVDIQRSQPSATPPRPMHGAPAADGNDDPAELQGVEEADGLEPELEPPGGLMAANSGVRTAQVARYSRDWRKPQYVDFRSPMLVGLFARLTRTLRDCKVHMEERCPGDGDLPRCDGIAYASEYVLQVSRAEAR